MGRVSGKASAYVNSNVECTDSIVDCLLMCEWEVLLGCLHSPKQIDAVLANDVITQDQLVYVPDVAVCNAVT